jgi:hypothetical protein
LDRVHRRSKSINSLRYYKFGVEDFKEFCDEQGIQDVSSARVYSGEFQAPHR